MNHGAGGTRIHDLRVKYPLVSIAADKGWVLLRLMKANVTLNAPSGFKDSAEATNACI